MLDYDSIAAICDAAEQNNISISALVLSDQAEQMELSEEELYNRMKDSLHVMQHRDKGSRQDTAGTGSGRGHNLSHGGIIFRYGNCAGHSMI